MGRVNHTTKKAQSALNSLQNYPLTFIIWVQTANAYGCFPSRFYLRHVEAKTSSTFQ